MPSFDIAKMHRVTVATSARWFLLTWLWRGGVIPRSAAARSPLTFAIQAFLLHQQASSDEPNLLEHLLRFFRTCFSSVLLENVDECLGGSWIGWNIARFSTEGLIQPVKDDRLGIAQASHLAMARSSFAPGKQMNRTFAW